MLAKKIKEEVKNGDEVSLEEYEIIKKEFDGKVEYIDGRIYIFAGGVKGHSVMIGRLCRAIGNNLKDGCDVAPELGLYIEKVNEKEIPIYPDVAVICDNSNDNEKYNGKIKFIIEVLSNSTAKYDSNEKKLKYKKLGVEEYVLVDIELKKIEVFDMKNDIIFGSTFYYEGNEEFEFVSKIRDDIRFKLKDIFKK